MAENRYDAIKAKTGGNLYVSAKSAPRGKGLIEGYGVTFGNASDRDLEGEYFRGGKSGTDFALDWFGGQYPILYHHGIRSVRGRSDVLGVRPIGRVKTVYPDDVGLFVQAELDLNEEYAKSVYGMVENGNFGFSSGAVDHLVQVAPDGEIKRWVLCEFSVTPTPAQPAKTTIRALKSILLPHAEYSEYLKGLDAIGAKTTSTAAAKFYSISKSSGAPMPSPMAVQYAKKQLRATGRRSATAEEIKEIAEEIDATVASYEEDPALMSLDEIDATASYEEDPALMSLEEDDALMSLEDDDALMSLDDEDDAVASYDEEDEATASYDEEDDATASYDDEDDATASLDEEEFAVAAARAVARRSAKRKGAQRKGTQRKTAKRKSVDPVVARLAERVRQLERMEAPGERNIGRANASAKSAQFTANDAQRRRHSPNYENLFALYIKKGESSMKAVELDAFRRKGLELGAWQFEGNPQAMKAALTTGQANSVGFGVPQSFERELIKNVGAQAVMMGEVRRRKTATDSLTLAKVYTSDARRTYAGGSAWIGETPANAAQTEANDFRTEQIQIPVHILMMNKTVSNTALQDVAFSVEDELAMQFAEEITIKMESAIFAGTGISSPLGIVTDPRVTTNLSTGVASVSGYVPLGSTTDINPDKLLEMSMQLPVGYNNAAKWYMNRNTLSVIRKIKDGNNQYLWTDGNQMQLGAPKFLFDYPIVISDYAPDISANGYPIIFGALSVGYTVVERQEFAIRRFDQDATYALQDQVLFIGRARYGGQVENELAIKVGKMSAA